MERKSGLEPMGDFLMIMEELLNHLEMKMEVMLLKEKNNIV